MKTRNTIILTLCLLLIMPAVLLCWGLVIPSQYDDTFMGELKYKAQRLDETEGKRIIVIGGSGVAFGMDSAAIEREIPGYSVVNMGMYAALGTEVMLQLSEPSIRRGDIVIISPEQHEQTLSCYFNPEIMWQGLDGAYSLFYRLSKEYQGQLVGEFPYFAASKFRNWLDGGLDPDGIYRRSSFNAYGDISAPGRENNVMPGGWDITTPVMFSESLLDESFITKLNGFAQRLHQKGAVVYYRFCPVNRLAVTEGDVDAFFSLLQEKLCFPIIGDPNKSLMDPEWFYDTNFHLNSAGAQLNTLNIVRDLKAMLLDSSPTKIAVPEKPMLGSTDTVGGDNSHEVYFLYSEFSNGWIITGVTAEGKTLGALTVPTEHDGKPVLAIGTGAFVDCTARSIKLQNSIEAIQDGAFENCLGLEKIILVNKDPSHCQVGQALLRGTEAIICVPEDVVSQYRVNYFWSAYASHIFPED